MTDVALIVTVAVAFYKPEDPRIRNFRHPWNRVAASSVAARRVGRTGFEGLRLGDRTASDYANRCSEDSIEVGWGDD